MHGRNCPGQQKVHWLLFCDPLVFLYSSPSLRARNWQEIPLGNGTTHNAPHTWKKEKKATQGRLIRDRLSSFLLAHATAAKKERDAS